MLVVADTSPLNYLILIEEIAVLPLLYPSVLIPAAVARELEHSGSPKKVREFIRSPPSWLTIVPVQILPAVLVHELDAGEMEAISLALGVHSSVSLMIDELRGRRAAQHLGLSTFGTLGILERAAQKGLLDLDTAVYKLRKTNFFASERLLRNLLARNARTSAS